jgi:hypothetical protein
MKAPLGTGQAGLFSFEKAKSQSSRLEPESFFPAINQ